MEFSTSLRRIRNERGIVQKDVAQALNVSLKTVSHWETGYSEPSVEQLKLLAKYFDVSVDELVGAELI
ncbi:MAG: helix-turn-helix transcriptional regulator [Clostridia bacterium]|jgi:transcriptional regulator with XRE-family HTH domain|nr:helix-turn-helix transcriptional regulator [Clostridia bacterium]